MFDERTVPDRPAYNADLQPAIQPRYIPSADLDFLQPPIQSPGCHLPEAGIPARSHLKCGSPSSSIYNFLFQNCCPRHRFQVKTADAQPAPYPQPPELSGLRSDGRTEPETAASPQHCTRYRWGGSLLDSSFHEAPPLHTADHVR